MVTTITGCLSLEEDFKDRTAQEIKKRCSTFEIHLRTRIRRCINVLTRENEEDFYLRYSPSLDELDLSYEWKLSRNNSGCLAMVRPFVLIGVWDDLSEIFDAYNLGIAQLQKKLAAEQHLGVNHTKEVKKYEHFKSMVDYLLYHAGMAIAEICLARQITLPTKIKEKLDNAEKGFEGQAGSVRAANAPIPGLPARKDGAASGLATTARLP